MLARTARGTWWQQNVDDDPHNVIAYFCAEFALHQSLPIYAGGLGVLAGDHCKEASDLGVPLVGVGLHVSAGLLPPANLAGGLAAGSLRAARLVDGADRARAHRGRHKPCVVLVPLGTRTVLVQVWEVRLGRVRLLLLDTDLEQNAPWDRELSARLYGGGQDTRLQQEIVLGLGGVLALRALGLKPAAWHLNEGHAAFVVLQRLRDFLASGVGVGGGARRSPAHDGLHDAHAGAGRPRRLPVPPGRAAAGQLLGIDERHTASQFLALGHYDSGTGPQFNMTALAMRSAGAINAVSQLHGEVTRNMFAPLWPDVPPDERPVDADHERRPRADVGLGTDSRRLFERHLSPALARPIRRSGVLAAHPRNPRRRSVGGAADDSRAVSLRSSSASARGSAGRRTRLAAGRIVAAGVDARPRRAHDRLRAPVHRLQAAGPRVPRAAIGWRAC